MAARLRKDGIEVELVRGGFGELRAQVDGRNVYEGHRFLYSLPGPIVRAVREALRG